MNKREMAERIASDTGITVSASKDAIDSIVSIILSELKSGNDVKISGLGKFRVRILKPRMGVNPKKPSEKVHVPEMPTPSFKASKTFKEKIRGQQRK